MRIIARYISTFFIRNFIASVAGLTVLFLLQALLGQIFDGKFPVDQVIVYNFMDIPRIFVQMIPPSILMATVLTLSGLTRTNELIACYSIGIGLRQIMIVILSIVFIVSCFALVMQDRILPPVFKKRTVYYWREMNQKSDFFLDVKQDKIWYRSQNLIYNLRTFDPKTRMIHGMVVYKFDEKFHLVEVIEAKQAQHTDQGWRLYKGTVTAFASDDSFPVTQEFQDKELQIAETPKDFQEIEKEVDGLRLKELRRYIDRTRQTGADTKTYEVNFHSKVSLSFIPLVMCILAIPFSVRSRREGGVAKDLGICFVVTFFYWLFYSVGLSLGTKGVFPPWLAAWLPSLVFLALATGLIVQRKK